MIAAVRSSSLALPGVLLVAAAAALATSALVLHLVSALAALALGLLILLRRKGTESHRVLGRVWVALMSIAAVSSFGPTGLRAGFSVIHLLSVWTLVAMALAIHFIRKGDVKRHKAFMVGTFLGLVGAAIGAMAPGRLLYRFFFGA
jgi:uncharacterized membrane protein